MVMGKYIVVHSNNGMEQPGKKSTVMFNNMDKAHKTTLGEKTEKSQNSMRLLPF